MTLFDNEPANFKPKFHAVGVYLEHSGKILLLQRHVAKPEGGTWCVAGGKVDANETAEQAARRETKEEIGVTLKQIVHAGTFYVQYETYAFVYHVFRAPLVHIPSINLKLDEHTQFTWATPQEALKYTLIEDEDAVLARVYGV